MENIEYRLSNGSPIFELFAAIYLALSIAGKVFSFVDNTSISVFSTFLKNIVFGNLTEMADKITASLDNTKGQIESILELIAREKYPVEYKKTVEFSEEMENLRSNTERVGKEIKDFIRDFTESIDTFIVRSSAILAVYCILAIIIPAILPKIEMLAMITLNIGTAFITVKMVCKPQKSRAETSYRSMITSLIVLIAIILILLPIISTHVESVLTFTEPFYKWSVIMTILIPPAYFLAVTSYYIIYSERKMDSYLISYEIHLDNLNRFGRNFRVFKNALLRQLKN